MTDTAADSDRVVDRWRFFHLIYIAFYFPEWLWRPPGTVDYVAIAIALAVFVPIFLSTSEKHLSEHSWHIGAYELIAIGLSPFSGLHGVFHIYACAQAGYQRPKRSAMKIIAGLSLFYVVFNLIVGSSTQDWFNAAFAVLFGAITGFGCMSHADSLERERNMKRARVLDRQRATLAERERIAQDMHDLLGHTLTMIAVKSDLASKLMDKDLDKARQEVDEVAGSARDALKEIRAAVYDMTVTTVEAEIELARQALDAAGIALTVDDDVPPLSPPLGKALGLTIREAVTNIVRHSKANRARIRLQPESGALTLTVSDNGVGGTSGSGRGAGLDGVRKRITALGGDMQLSSRDGTELRVSLPLSDEFPASGNA
ncbi:MAG: sensor histidine kinase [Pseudomonadota bacterium]